MSDDLVKRLLADKLELEVRNRELALQVIESEGQAQEAYERQVELEAKLAKAVAGRDEALNQLDSARQSVDVLEKRVANLLCGYDEHRKPFVTSRTTLAELKGDDE